jgi:hypothetical protein
MSILERHPRVTDSVKRAGGVDLISRSTLAALHYVGSVVQNKPEEADAFLNVFRTGVPAWEGCPAHAVREMMIRLRSSRKTMMSSAQCNYLIHAWNQFVAHKVVMKVRLPDEVILEGWTPDVCFGVGSTLAVRATEAVKAARMAASAAERLTAQK